MNFLVTVTTALGQSFSSNTVMKTETEQTYDSIHESVPCQLSIKSVELKQVTDGTAWITDAELHKRNWHWLQADTYQAKQLDRSCFNDVDTCAFLDTSDLPRCGGVSQGTKLSSQGDAITLYKDPNTDDTCSRTVCPYHVRLDAQSDIPYGYTTLIVNLKFQDLDLGSTVSVSTSAFADQETSSSDFIRAPCDLDTQMFRRLFAFHGCCCFLISAMLVVLFWSQHTHV